MEQVRIASRDVASKSALRNLKSAIQMSAMLLALCLSAQAQQSAKIPRIGYLAGGGDPSTPGPSVEAFRRGLRDLGYI